MGAEINGKMDGVGTKFDELAKKVDVAMQTANDAKEDVKTVDKQVDDLQEEVRNLHVTLSDNQKKAAYELEKKLKSDLDHKFMNFKVPEEIRDKIHDRSNTLVVTGLDGLETEAKAHEWVITRMKEHSLDVTDVMLMDFYSKGEQFNGVLFFNLPDADIVTKIFNTMSNTSVYHQDTSIRFKKDIPLKQRAPLGVLLGLRWQLGEWGYNKAAIKVNDAMLTMAVAGKQVLSIRTQGEDVVLDWKDQEWKEWTQLQNSNELKQLTENANRKLKQAADATKGLGKGKKGKQ